MPGYHLDQAPGAAQTHYAKWWQRSLLALNSGLPVTCFQLEVKSPESILQVQGTAPRELIPSHCRGCQGAKHPWVKSPVSVFDKGFGSFIPLRKGRLWGPIPEQWVCICGHWPPKCHDLHRANVTCLVFGEFYCHLYQC